ncbi:MAG: hypothetical protein DWQ01_06345 [Planctomycetota bacterium]|nr:MAG: hypothetical protein DWQ01_06345 [Planctomycetota bacterium]
MIVRGLELRWPDEICTCCGEHGNEFLSWSDSYKATLSIGVVSTYASHTSEVKVPVCSFCKKHINQTGLSNSLFFIGAMLALLSPIALYVYAMLHRSETARFFGMAPRDLWKILLPGAALALVVGFLGAFWIWSRRMVKLETGIKSNCSGIAGGVQRGEFRCNFHPASDGTYTIPHDEAWHILMFDNRKLEAAFRSLNQIELNPDRIPENDVIKS